MTTTTATQYTEETANASAIRANFSKLIEHLIFINSKLIDRERVDIGVNNSFNGNKFTGIPPPLDVMERENCEPFSVNIDITKARDELPEYTPEEITPKDVQECKKLIEKSNNIIDRYLSKLENKLKTTIKPQEPPID